MTYRIWIGATTDGNLVIGASLIKYYREKKQLASTEQVYGVQIRHRVVALTPDGYRLMTPTKARDNDYKITDEG